MKSKVLKELTRYQMISRGERVLVALSGGADSVALLHILRELREEWQLELGALHLNHRLRGEESERDESFVRALCERWGIPLTISHADVRQTAKNEGESMEECGRRLRYAFFAQEAKAPGAKVATAHTASDNAETILINFARGTALRGLAGIPPVRGNIIRPLITCTRAEVESYCRDHALIWVEDSTNQSDDYTRNRIRRHLIPLLEQENPRLFEGISALSMVLREDADYLDDLAEQARERITLPDGGLDTGGFLALTPALKGRVLAGLLRSGGITVNHGRIESMSAIISAGGGSIQVGGGEFFVCSGESFSLRSARRIPLLTGWELRVPTSGLERGDIQLIVPYGRQLGLRLRQKKLANIQKKDLNYCLDYDRIVNVVILRTRLPGDKLRLPGRGCTKTLKKLYQEYGVDAQARERRLIIADDAGVLWVEGFGPDERAAVTDKTAKTLQIALED